MGRPPRLVAVPADWRSLIRRSDTGKPIVDIRNVLIILRNEPAFRGCFGFDEMHQAIKVLDYPPICGGAEGGAEPPRFADREDSTRLQEFLQQLGLARLGREAVEDALAEFARERTFHPVRDYLNKVGDAWDGQPLIGQFLHLGLGCPDDEYHRQIGGMFLMSMVARVMRPGCQCDYMLVLEGPQGEEKSKFCRLLAGEDYFSDHLPRLEGDQVRVSMHMRGKWLIEISELSAFSKSEAGALKAFLTRREEIYCPKYERKERREARQGVFVGTTNDDEYIRDDTGGRRYWPAKVVKVDLDWVERHRDALFGEAVKLIRNKHQYWPDRLFEKSIIAPKQDARQVFDQWTDRVLEIAMELEVVTIPAVWEKMGTNEADGSVRTDITKLDMVAQKRIGGILKKHYLKDQDKYGKRIWVPKPESQTVPDPLDPFSIEGI
jgi:predicted P-loop ATPase